MSHDAPTLPAPLAGLPMLAANLRSTWDPPARALFEDLDPETWRSSAGNPVAVVQALAGPRAAEIAGDAALVERIRSAVADLEAYLAAPRWWDGVEGGPDTVAYFSPEFGITRSCPSTRAASASSPATI
jgi:starch phosphorylase